MDIVENVENIFNLFIFVEEDIVYELGAVVHQRDGRDEEKISFLQNRVKIDLKEAHRFPVPDRYKLIDPSINKYIPAIKYEHFRTIQRMNMHLEVFEEVLQSFNASSNPLFCMTPVTQEEIRIDAVGDFQVAEDSNSENIKEIKLFSSDYLVEYCSELGFDFPRLLDDDYFKAIKLLLKNKYYVSALKLLMSCIDTLAYLEYGDEPNNFTKWLDNYVNLSELEITSDELWEVRNSLLHMTNLDSRKVRAGKIRRISFYIGELKKSLPDKDDESKYFNLKDLFEATANGSGKWIHNLSTDREKYKILFERYDQIVSDSRYLTVEIK